MAKKYIIRLTEEEREGLLALVKRGKGSARMIRRANAQLLSDEGKTDQVIAQTLHMGVATVARVRKKAVLGNLACALGERPRPGAERKLSDEQETLLISMVRSPPPVRHEGWTLQQLVDRLVESGVVESISRETVRQVLKKHHVRLGGRS
jgi:transposase